MHIIADIRYCTGMSFIEISAYKCLCERCQYEWSAFKLPPTCARCRSPYWNRAKSAVPLAAPIEKPMAAKIVEEPKEKKLADLQAIIESVQSKPKSDYYTKPHSALPQYRPQEWEEPTIS
jgi:hypothetical protein